MLQRWKQVVRKACAALAGLVVGAGMLLPAGQALANDAPAVQTVNLMEGTKHETPMTVIKGAKAGPTVLVVGGLHGDKPSGVEAAKQLTQFRDLEAGTLLVIPELNREAVAAGRRHTGTDLNRAFPTSRGETPTDPRAAAVWQVLQDYNVDYLLDLHEDGSSSAKRVIFQPVGTNKVVAQKIVDAVNNGLSKSSQWVLGGIPIKSGLTRAAQDWLGVNSFYVNAWRSNTMSTRVEQHRRAVMTVLEHLRMTGSGAVTNPPAPEQPRPEQPRPQQPRPEEPSNPGTPSQPKGSVTTKTLLPGTKYATTLYIIDSGRPGPVVWISGGVHGSELAGWMAAEQIANWRVERGKLLVLPHANAPAVKARLRSASGDGDLNREFPMRSGEAPKSQLARAIWNELQAQKPDWVLDLHEAMSNRNINPSSVGQTIIAHPSTGMMNMANQLVSQINRGLSSTLRFQVLRYPVQGSLARAAGQVLGANAAIVETSRLYSLENRIQWHLTMMENLLKELDMAPSTGGRDSAAAPAATASSRAA